MSVTNWASNKRNKKPKNNKKNLPEMTWQGPVSRWIASRIATLGDQRLVTTGDLQEQAEKLHPSSIPSNRILTKLALTIEAEIPAFTFDYFLLHDQCWRYLELLRDALDPVIADKSLKQWTSQKQYLPIVMGFGFQQQLEGQISRRKYRVRKC
jgi:hypothetical protein